MTDEASPARIIASITSLSFMCCVCAENVSVRGPVVPPGETVSWDIVCPNCETKCTLAVLPIGTYIELPNKPRRTPRIRQL